jgi:hypothetical protein
MNAIKRIDFIKMAPLLEYVAFYTSTVAKPQGMFNATHETVSAA